MKILLIILAIGFIVLMLRSQQLEKLWQQHREEQGGIGDGIGRIRTQAAQWLQSVRDRIRPAPPQPANPAAFVAWVTNSLTLNTETTRWFQSLTPEHLAVLTQFTDEFCQSMGFELNWLLNEELTNRRNLADSLTAVVHHYIEACWLTFAVRDDLLAFSAAEPELAATRNEMEQSVKTELRQNGKTAEFNTATAVSSTA